jgi:hypothetical protein
METQQDVYYIVDIHNFKVDRIEMSRAGVISVRAGVSLLREEQLDYLAQVFSTTLENVVNVLQNPPDPFTYTDTTPRDSDLVGFYDEAPVPFIEEPQP